MIVLIKNRIKLEYSLYNFIKKESTSHEQDVKSYPSGVRLNITRFFCTPGLRTKYFERLFCLSINYKI